ncbi:MAG TPA: hypothetical protein PKD91_14720, partial [Bacteroidia bacterium]|nr:hypothetical protein [Bacteroidia bacterium]
FSYGGIFAKAGVTDVEIDHCYIHHVKGTGGGDTYGKGYGIWIQGGLQSDAVGTDFSITNSIFDECKAAVDAQPNPANVTIENCTFGNY